MSARSLALLATALVLAGVLLFLLVRRGDGVRAGAPDPAPVAVASAPGSAAEPTPARAAPHPRARRLGDRAARDRLVAAITEARTARTDPGTTSNARPQAPSLPPGELDKEYVRASVHEIVPLVKECYETALAREPELAGRVTVKFTIEGEPDVGGVIGSSEIIPERTSIADPELRECIQETMYAIEIDPPANGGTVTVNYPFTFATK